ncbi:HTH_48 domain-containing protein [Trichonephila clavipes]|nr:HTH_48 domain-containing protein [Trichonephila clavipes]
MEWQHTSSPVKVKAKQMLSKRKIMATVFWDRRGVLLVDFMPNGTAINSGAYCETLRKLRRALQNKWRGMLSKGALHLHDNARPHTSRTTRELIESGSLGRKRFSDNEVKAADQAADFFEEGFQNLVLRCDKCINKLGNYVENRQKYVQS